jgi:protein-S-isoprenylcysteine O-methyltransferase Ste14
MPLIEEFEASGHWLFRWRSYLPLIFTVLVLSGLSSFRYPFGSHMLDQLWEGICLGVSFLGFVVRAITVGYAAGRTSGRNTKQQVADSLNTTGMYSVVRNPLYLGNFLIVLGVVVFLRIWWLPLLYLLLFTLYYERIIFAEEMFLRRKFGRHYMDWASWTPAFLPRINQWKTPEVPFSWKKVLRREYHGVFGLIVAMFLLEVAGDVYSGHGFKVDVMWTIILSFAGASYVIIRFLHKHTAVFRGEGRRGSHHDTGRPAVR